jgi:hypothetical protein
MPSSAFPCLSLAVVRSRFNLVIAFCGVLLAGAGGLTSDAQTTTSYTSSGSSGSPAISISGSCSSSIPVSGCSSTSSTYGKGGYGFSAINVPATGTVTQVVVTLNGLTSSGFGESPASSDSDSLFQASIYLVSPGGQKFELLGCTGDSTDGDGMGDSGSGLDDVIVTIEDGQQMAPGARPSTDTTTAWQHTGSITVEPSSYWLQSAGCSDSVIPTNAEGLTLPQTDGTATMNGTFAGGATNGNWTLYVLNDDTYSEYSANDPISITNWTLKLTYEATASASTTTSVSSSLNPVNSGSGVTFTAYVSSTSTVDVGTVAFMSNGATISACGSQPVSNGQATCNTSFTQGLYSIGASYSGGTGFLSSSANNLNQLVEGTTTSGGTDTFCNTGSIPIAELTTSSIYPSIIKVTGFPGKTVSNVEVKLLDVTGTIVGSHLLVSPDGAHNLDFLDEGFSETANSSGSWLDFFDLAGQYPDYGTPPANSSTSPVNYEASDLDSQKVAFPVSIAPSIDSAIPSVPGTFNYGYNSPNPDETYGPVTETFESNFNGATADGDWALYPYMDFGNIETIAGGWCIALTLNTGVATTTTITSSKGDQTTGQPVTLTATVTSEGSPISSGGTVTFLENGVAPPGTVSGNNVVTLNSNGQAPFTTSSLPEGDNEIVAEYAGDSSDNPSQATFWQRIDDATTVTGSSGTYTYCNSGEVAVNANTGPFTPNPSNIFVTNLPGTVSSMSLTLKNFSTESDSIFAHESLIEGPTGAALDFFSNVGNESTTILSEGNYTFEDSASGLVPQANFSPGSFKPTSYANIHGTADLFYSSLSPSSSNPYYVAPTSFGYAGTRGSSTFGNTFGDTNPNGTWSLFFDTLETVDETDLNGWCMSFTENAATVSVDLTHQGDGTGTDFVQGETSAQIITVVTAGSNGPTGDPLGTNPLKVVDNNLNSALTYTGFTGSGWSCTTPPATSVTCANDSAVASGSSYPTLTLNVNVSSTAPSSISNSVTVSGAGVTSVTPSDTIPVDANPVLAVSKAHTGTFTQGSTGIWTITVSNTAANGSTSGAVDVSDTLPTGYTLNSYTSTSSLWTCGGSSNVVTCSGTPGIAGGSNSMITLTVNVPANSPTSVSNTAEAWGGGDTLHTSQGTAAQSNTDSVTVAQVPASVSVGAGNNQSATVATAFGTELVALVKDGAGATITGTPVTFTVNPAGNGAGATFSNGTGTITQNTNNGGQAPVSIIANNIAGAYTVTAQAGSASTTFNLTNNAGLPTAIAITGGNNQSAQDGSAFGLPLGVQVTDTYNNPVSGVTVTFTAPSTGASLSFAGGVNTAVTNGSGVATAAVATANSIAGSYQVTAAAGALQVAFSLTNQVGSFAQFAVNTPATAFVGAPFSFTVTAQDSGGNTVTSYAGTMTLSSTDSAAVLPANPTLTNGTGTFMATLNSTGSQTITATDEATSIYSTSNQITVSPIPYFVVNYTADDAGSASLCQEQNSPGVNTTDSACGLRDALLAAAGAGAGNISFSTSAFTSSQVITLSNGTLNIPVNTSITGPTSGSGASLQNLVTISGNNASTVFTVASGVTDAAISNLGIVSGNGGTGNGGGISSNGVLTVSNSTFTGNAAANGGAISFTGSLNVFGSTFNGNSATADGGAIYGTGSGSTLSLIDSTFNLNSAAAGGAMAFVDVFGTIADSTITGNSSTSSGGGMLVSNGAALTLQNSILEGNSATSFFPDAFISGGTLSDSNGNVMNSLAFSTLNPNLAPLSNYGGPTQTMVPLPGSAAICGGLASSIPSGVTTDERGFLNQNLTYPGYSGSNPCVDAGAVQSNYAIGFTTQPQSNVGAGAVLNPAPVVSLTEQGAPIAVNAGTVTMTDTAGLLTGTLSEAIASGAATFSDLVFPTDTIDDTLNATLALNASINLTAQATTAITVGNEPAALLSPTPGLSTILGTSAVQFTWSNGIGVTSYKLFLGTTGPGSSNLYASSVTSGTTAVAPTIPANGATVFAELGSLIGGVWQYENYQYTESGTLSAATLTPSSGALSTSQPFTWSNGVGPAEYQLLLGTSGPDSSDLYSSGATTNTSATVTIPSNGVTVFATLKQLIDGVWQSTAYTFAEPGIPTPATLTPSSGTLATSQTFTWNNGVGTSKYQLQLGTSGFGSTDILSTPDTTATTVTVSIPSNGVTVYATFYQLVNGAWQKSEYTFTEPGTPTPATLSPSSGILATSQTFTWSNGAGPVQYQLLLGTTAGSSNLYNSGATTNTQATVTIPSNGVTVFATFKQLISGTWQSTAYTLTEPGIPTPATLSPSSGTLATSQTFTWSNGAGPALYMLQLGTSGFGSTDLLQTPDTTATTATVSIPSNGVNVYATFYQLINGAWQKSEYTFTEPGTPTPATLSPSSGTLATSQTFTWNNGAGPAYYDLLLGTAGASSSNLYNSGATTNTSATVAIPSNGVTVFATFRQLINGVWQSTAYTFTEPGSPTPATLSPSSGMLATSQTFTWNNGAGPALYQLLLGTSGPDSSDLYYSGATTNTSATITIPSNGVTVFATFRQLINGTWQSAAYTFTEPGTLTPATLSPSSGTLSTSQTFTWSNGAGPAEYQLQLGTSGFGSTDLLHTPYTTATTATVSIPSNGVTVYAAFYQLINGAWQKSEYTFTEPGTPTPATLSPSSGTLSTSQTFTWNNGAGAVDYVLLLGTAGAGSSNLYNSQVTPATSATVSIPSNGVTVYATLKQLINGTWQSTAYTFTESAPPPD